MLKLQTLILRNCDLLRELPKGIKKLVNLRFLDITNCRQLINMHTITKIIAYKELTYMPLEIGHHTYLETILPFVVRKESSGASNCGSDKKKKAKSNGALSDLEGLRNLGGKLRIEKLRHGKDEVRECNDTNLYIYKTEAFEAPTVFHVSIYLFYFLNFDFFFQSFM